MDEFALECSEEAFHDGVVPAVPSAAEAAFDAMVAECPLVVVTGVLRPAVRMLEQAGLWQPLADRHRQCRQYDVGVQARLDGPADDAPREEVDDNGQVQPALVRSYVGDVASPDAIGARDVERPVEGVRHGNVAARGS